MRISALIVFVIGLLTSFFVAAQQDEAQQARILWAIGNQMGGVHYATFYNDRENTLKGLNNVIELLRSNPCMDATPWVNLLAKLQAGSSPKSLFREVIALEDVPASGVNLPRFACRCGGSLVPPPTDFDLTGVWQHGGGGETWTFTPLGGNRYRAQEVGFANAYGIAVVSGNKIRIDFTWKDGSHRGSYDLTLATDARTAGGTATDDRPASGAVTLTRLRR